MASAQGRRDAQQPEFSYDAQAGRVFISAGKEVVLTSPTEGLWSIACGWKDQWPADWHHAAVQHVSREGEWTIFQSKLAACGGEWSLQDSYRLHDGLVEGRRRFAWMGKGAAPHVTLSVRYQMPPGHGQVMLPGLIYSGNPSGERSGKVPVYKQRTGEEAFFEEHRFPEPFVFKEQGSIAGAMHSLPSPVAYCHLQDQWWSMGLHELPSQVTEFELLSGPTSANSERGTVRAVQGGSLPYKDAYLNIPAGGVVEKHFYLDAYAVVQPGSGFERSVWSSIQLFQPYSLDGMPSAREIVAAKYRYALTRWFEQGSVAGFRKYPDRKDIVMGWTGEAEGPGYALQVLGSHLQDPQQAHRIALRSLDFLSTATFYNPGFHYWWMPDSGTWQKGDLLNQAQAMMGFARAVRVGRAHHEQTTAWEGFLHRAATIHAKRILREDWHPDQTAEAFFIAPLLASSDLFHDASMKAAGLKAAEYFASRHLSMQLPYWGGTSDAECEDKEGAYGAMQGFLAAYDVTHDARYLGWAQHAADVVLSYLVVWDIDLPAGPLRDAGLKTHGWTAVSVQNQHLDVFGALIAPDLYRLGTYQHDERLRRLAIVMFRSAGQLIDAEGSQGEQIYQTNYTQRGKPTSIDGMRGAYNDSWTVFWVTAHFLSGAAELQELGAPLWSDARVAAATPHIWGPQNPRPQ